MNSTSPPNPIKCAFQVSSEPRKFPTNHPQLLRETLESYILETLSPQTLCCRLQGGSPRESVVGVDSSRAQRELICELESKNREIMREIARLRREQESGVCPEESPALVSELRALRQRKVNKRSLSADEGVSMVLDFHYICFVIPHCIYILAGEGKDFIRTIIVQVISFFLFLRRVTKKPFMRLRVTLIPIALKTKTFLFPLFCDPVACSFNLLNIL